MGYKKIEHYDEKCTKSLSSNYKEVIENLGEDPSREGLLKTPERVAKAMQFLTQGYDQNPQEILKSAMFTEIDDIDVLGYHMYMTPAQAARGIELFYGTAPFSGNTYNDYPDVSKYSCFQSI